MKLACILLASGQAERFGKNKLLAEFDGKTLAERALDAVPNGVFDRVAVVTAYPEIEKMAEERGFEVVKNTRPEEGLRLTIRLGLEQVEDADACMFCVCDQPYMDAGTLRGMAESYEGGILMLSFGERRGNPAIFPKELFGELMALGQGEAGVTVIDKHKETLRLFPAKSPRELEDVDTVGDMDRLQI